MDQTKISKTSWQPAHTTSPLGSTARQLNWTWRGAVNVLKLRYLHTQVTVRWGKGEGWGEGGKGGGGASASRTADMELAFPSSPPSPLSHSTPSPSLFEWYQRLTTLSSTSTLSGACSEGPVLGLLGPLSIHCGWVTQQVSSATSVSVWQHTQLSGLIYPWDTPACTNQPTNQHQSCWVRHDKAH